MVAIGIHVCEDCGAIFETIGNYWTHAEEIHGRDLG